MLQDGSLEHLVDYSVVLETLSDCSCTNTDIMGISNKTCKTKITPALN